MRYHHGCRLFKTKHWGALWQSNVPDLDTLKERQCTFVAIDFEGRASKDGPLDITEIGLAVLYPPVASKSPSPDGLRHQGQSLENFSEQNAIESHWIRVRGRERDARYCKDRYRVGAAQEIDAEGAEEALVSLLQSIKNRSGNSPLVLVGFDLVFEFIVIASHLSQITKYFASWVDLQDIAAEVSGDPKAGHLSMKTTLLAFGFFARDLAGRGKGGHNAGNDAVRILAVLVNLLRMEKGRTIGIDTGLPKEENALRRIWTRDRPSPRELYPFTARIRIEGKDLKYLARDCQQLFYYFSDYQPTAVGMTRAGNYGWVCLPTKEELHRFVHDLHGHEFEDETWIVVADYDPQTPHLTPEQYREAKRAEQEAQRKKKQLERRMKRDGELGERAGIK
ncbi:hypothetical protein GGR52DRAFT_559254 [Hypoxylon sp. FL1284]|nr:hypothetical protein GGR52DRAFT_559254 [Hypoxylon sp. FL1284]